MDDQLKELIASNKDLIDTAIPNQAVFSLILEKLEKRKRKKRVFRMVLFSTVSSVAAILVIGFFIIGFDQNLKEKGEGTDNEKMANRLQVPPSTNIYESQVEPEDNILNKRHGNENKGITIVNETEKLYSFQTAVSPAARLTAIYKAEKKSKLNKHTLFALFEVLRSDPNTNVRLAAVDVLASYSSDSEIRRRMIYAMAEQDNPLIQLAMIQLLTGFKEKELIEKLGQIIEDPKTDDGVREEARFSYAQCTSILNSKL
jgi:LysM repeat protein